MFYDSNPDDSKGFDLLLGVVIIVIFLLALGLGPEDVLPAGDDPSETGGLTPAGGIDASTPTATPESDLNVSDGAVVPDDDYYANVTLLGTEFGEPVAVRIVVGDEVHDPWPDDVNDGGNPRTHVIENGSAGGGLSVVAEWPGNATVDSTDADDPRVRVLRNGDGVPDLEGLGDQPDASAILAPYTSNGTVDLERNQAIFLFELYTTDTSADAFDLQDAVVLATVNDEDEQV